MSKEVTCDIPGCLNISDDILVYGKTQEEYDQSLEKLLRRAKLKNITFNKAKCEFNKESCLYYGMVFSKQGASPDPQKVEAIKAAEPPRNAKEMNSFLCTVQYNARFMDKFAPQTDLLLELLKVKVFTRRKVHQEAFESLKEALSSDTVLAYFDPTPEYEVHVDGCPLGISATLVQRGPGDNDWRVVQYASRSLSDAERKYSQIELEMLAADFTCKKFHVFLYGLPFTIVTYHKPLQVIFSNPRHQTSIRLQRMTVRMFDYEFKVEYRPGKTNISYYTSRHPLPRENCTKRELGTTKDVNQYVNFIVSSDIPRAISKEELIKATDDDRELQNVNRCIREKRFDHGNKDMQVYANVSKVLTVVEGLVLRGERIVVPRGLRESMVKIAHGGHQRIIQTKRLLRAHVWFPGIDAVVEKHVGRCLACQATTPSHTREPLQVTELPMGVWKKVSVDFARPFPNNDMVLVFWDQY